MSHFRSRGIGPGGNGQPHGHPAPPRQHDLLHRVEQVFNLFVVLQHHVGVAGNAKGGRGRHFASRKGRGQVRRDHVFHRRQMNALLCRQADQPRQLGGHGHNTTRSACGVRAARERRPLRVYERGHVQLQVRQQRPRRQVLHRQRRQDRQNFAAEIGLEELPLLGGPLRPAARRAGRARPGAPAPRATPAACRSTIW